MKALVFLGLRHAILADQWKKEFKEGRRNDTMLYGYGNAADDDFKVNYCRFNRLERFFFKDNLFGKMYLYLFKLPILLTTHDIVWTHVDRDSLFVARLRSIPVIKKLFCKQISNFVWLIDHTKDFTAEKKLKIAKQLKVIDKVLFLSPSEKELFIKYYGCPEQQLLYTRYGIRFDAYGGNALAVKPAGFEHERFILSVGTDQHRDLKLLEEVAKLNPDKIFIVCSGSPEHLTRKFQSKNLFIMKATYNEMVFLYRSCEQVIIPLRFNYHASGITTLLEAAAARKPTVINMTPGLEDYGIDGETCLFVPLNDAEKFSSAINLIREKIGLSEYLTNNAYNYLRADFNTDEYSKIYIKLSQDLLKK